MSEEAKTGEGGEAEAKPPGLSFASVIFGGAGVFAVLVANVGVLSRYVFKVSIPSVEEILGFLFVWLIFVCSALSFREGTLISITMLGDALKNRPFWRRLLDIFQNLSILVFSLVILYTGWRMLRTQFEFDELSVVMEINRGWMTLGALLGFLLFAYYAFRNIFKDVFDPGKFISVRIRRSFRGFFREE